MRLVTLLRVTLPQKRSHLITGGGYPFVKPGNLDQGKPITQTEETLSERGISLARKLRCGTVLVSCIGSLGKIGVAGTELATNQQLNAIEFTPGLVDDMYGYHFCKTLKPWMENEASATTVTILNKSRFSKAPLILAPLNEQKRIADKLDQTLAIVERAKARLARVPGILKQFRQSVLAAATDGRLTEDWRDELCITDGWKSTNVGLLLKDIRYGTAKKCYYEPQDIPVIRIPNLCDGRVTHENMKYAEFDETEYQKLALADGDILMIRSNGSVDLVGRTALVTEKDKGFLYAGYLIRLRTNHQLVVPAYLTLALSSPKSRNAIELTARSTSGVNNINTDEIKSLMVELPALPEQSEIIRRVETLFALADRIEARYQAVSEKVDKLTQSLPAKAFRGELVPQDPNDEPAGVLLERIRAQRKRQANRAAEKARKSRHDFDSWVSRY
jgi:type I restriction enzyme, S subunit